QVGHQVDHGRLAVGVGGDDLGVGAEAGVGGPQPPAGPPGAGAAGARGAGTHRRCPGPGARPSPGALTTTGALNASTCTRPAWAGFSDSCWVAPAASCLTWGAEFLPVSTK